MKFDIRLKESDPYIFTTRLSKPKSFIILIIKTLNLLDIAYGCKEIRIKKCTLKTIVKFH